jgi:hypothetical protein
VAKRTHCELRSFSFFVTRDASIDVWRPTNVMPRSSERFREMEKINTGDRPPVNIEWFRSVVGAFCFGEPGIRVGDRRSFLHRFSGLRVRGLKGFDLGVTDASASDFEFLNQFGLR